MTPRQRNRWKRRLDKAHRTMARGMNLSMRAEFRRVASEAGRGDLLIERHAKRLEAILARWWLATAQVARLVAEDMLAPAQQRQVAPAKPTREEVDAVIKAIVATAVAAALVSLVIAAIRNRPGVVSAIEAAILANPGDIGKAAAQAASAPAVQAALIDAVADLAPDTPRPATPPGGPPRLPPPAGGGVPPVPPEEAWEDLIARQVREQAVTRSRKIAGATQQQVTDVLAKAAKEGLGEDATRKRLEESLTNTTAARARTIARTEINAAQNKALIVSAESRGQKYRREWLAIEDARTRPTHAVADGQVIAPGEKFRVGLAMLDHPGDPSGPPGEIINCRCAMLLLPVS